MNDRSSQPKPKVRLVTITEAHEGQRVDNFLLRELKGVPKSRIYRILRKGEVRVNKSRVKPEYKLQEGDLVRIPPVIVAERNIVNSVSDGLTRHLQQAVLYEDSSLLIINKPSGLAVHGGSGISLGLIEALRILRPQAKFLELVHRLDRDTSGCVMVAKKRSMLKYLQNCLRERHSVDKRYLALVAGSWSVNCNLVSAALLKTTLQSGERVVNVSAEGKKSTTKFNVINRYADATLVQASPITGRTHQIRVHALHAGCPLLGDDKYGEVESNRLFKQRGLNRLFLHAESLRLQLPDSAEQLKVTAPLEPALEKLLATFQRAH